MIFAPFVLAMLSLVPAASEADCSDARLSDIFFVDTQRGWAVGDRGAILCTEDGGRNWRLQKSGMTCNLRSVSFLNDQIGWAAGGFSHPYTHTSTGVLLATEDGGATWTSNPKLGLPALRRAHFFDPRHGWAIGCSSAMYPTGVFVTENGGRNWQPVPGNAQPGGWLAAEFLDLHSGALAGRNGALAKISQGQIEAARSDRFDLRSLNQMRFSMPYGWLIGDDGMVRFSNDFGVTWQTPMAELPKIARQFDFTAMAVRGPKLWIAGTPGTRIFYTPDAGRTWNSFATGSSIPLRALWFVDDLHGWAVGELGTILATADGGQTWQRQRAGGERAALMALLAEPDDVPFELIAHLSGGDGYLSVVNVLGRRDIEIPPRENVSLNDRLHEAVVRVGGSATETAWQFPLRQAGLFIPQEKIVEGWDHANDGRGLDQLQSYLVRQIRLWRPEVILTNDLSRAGRLGDQYNASLYEIVHHAVLQSVTQAANPSVFSDQITEAGLSPWTVKRVFAAMPSGMRGTIEESIEQFCPRLGCSLAEAAAEPRGLLQDRFSVAPPIVGFRLLQSALPQDQPQRDFFSGLAIVPGGPARRALASSSGEGVDLRQRIDQKRRHVQAILEHAGRTTGSVEPLLAQIDELGRDLDEQSRGQILFQLADRYYHTGHWALAAETFQLLADRYPQHARTPQALLWLLQYYAGSEAACRVERGDAKKRFEQAVKIGERIERAQPEMFPEPALCFPLAAAYRGLDQARQAEQFLRYTNAEADKPTLVCITTPTKPHLDGVLDDPTWEQAKPAALQSAQHDDGDWPAEVMMAHDAEFLYIAVRCRAADRELPPSVESTSSRQRDGNLSAYDRVEVFLDIDRDFTTYYRLAIDRRGWTNDACWYDETWDPKWFVAAKQESGQWTAEAAIPLVELVGSSPPPGTTWAIGVQRTVPGVGFQSWSAPAAISVLPNGFGYLVFR